LTVNTCGLTAVTGVAMVIVPVVAPKGTVAATWPLESTVKLADTPLNFTLVFG